ncbi:glycosyl transferase family protein [Staphylococcus schleiferi]|uniref:Glycosyl transferase family protein n=1 Tax=Staphylococcus schleiferi TaxID=1295 RepID=A0A7Z7QQR4_STASC|nr:glycosyl transferase family protein [Staphylococcus schleiferi]SUM89629.1 glycosyl transferase family protein [Staphylococcus schleiferi]
MVPGALGQDSLFFLTMIHHAQAIKVVDATVHVYYAGIANSMTNQISEQFFRKYYLVEREKVKFLKQHGYLSTYMNHRFNYYVKHWYISRINRTTEKDPKCVESIFSNH